MVHQQRRVVVKCLWDVQAYVLFQNSRQLLWLMNVIVECLINVPH